MKYTHYFLISCILFSVSTQGQPLMKKRATPKRTLRSYLPVVGASVFASVGVIAGYKIYQYFNNNRFKLTIDAGEHGIQGKRIRMEDAFIIDTTSSLDYHFFAIFDGHGGSSVSARLADRKKGIYAQFLEDKVTLKDADSLTLFFKDYDTRHFKNKTIYKGSTAVMLIHDLKSNEGYLINLGDSAGYVMRDGRIIHSTIPHKPKDEEARIKAAGGSVIENRINSIIAVSRAFGDYSFKQTEPFLVSNIPDVINLGPLIKGDTIVLCCDGVTDVLSPEEIFAAGKKGGTAPEAARAIVDEAFERGSTDNISALVIRVP